MTTPHKKFTKTHLITTTILKATTNQNKFLEHILVWQGELNHVSILPRHTVKSYIYHYFEIAKIF